MTRPSNEKRKCAFCGDTKPLAECDTIQAGALVVQACADCRATNPACYRWITPEPSATICGNCDADSALGQQCLCGGAEPTGYQPASLDGVPFWMGPAPLPPTFTERQKPFVDRDVASGEFPF